MFRVQGLGVRAGLRDVKASYLNHPNQSKKSLSAKPVDKNDALETH